MKTRPRLRIGPFKRSNPAQDPSSSDRPARQARRPLPSPARPGIAGEPQPGIPAEEIRALATLQRVRSSEAPELRLEACVARLRDRSRPLEIVLTGGPCGGKSTAIKHLAEKLKEKGYRPFIVPESATMVITGGVSDIVEIAVGQPERFLELQRRMVHLQRALRQQFLDLAGIFDERAVVLYDRGEMDNQAYVAPAKYDRLLREEGLDVHHTRDSYDAVLHLVTAADGAEAFYTVENNDARKEDLAQAKALDGKTLRGWLGHPRLTVVDNSTDFEGKLARSYGAVASIVDDQAPDWEEASFPVCLSRDAAVLEGAHSSRVVEWALPAEEGVERSLVRRTEGAHTLYSLTETELLPSGNRSRRRLSLCGDDFRTLGQLADTSPRRYERVAFVHQQQSFVAEFPEGGGSALLRVRATGGGVPPKPSFVE